VGGVPNSLTQMMSGQIDIAWSAVPFNLADVKAGKLRILARGSDVAAFKNQTIRVNFSTAATLAAKADAFARYNRAYIKIWQWAYKEPTAAGYFVEAAGISPEVAKETLDEFLPQSAIQPYKVEGLDLVLKEAADFKYTPKLLTPADVAPLFADVVKPPA
jgi:NitT/TauT family transport system substrate-binding protein